LLFQDLQKAGFYGILFLMKYTREDLRRNSEAYEKNFQLLKRTVGTPDHEIYVKIERELNKRDCEIRKEMRFRLVDPCPLTKRNKACSKCTGRIKKIDAPRSYQYAEAKEGEGALCSNCV